MKHSILRRLKRLTDQRWKIRELARELRKELDRKMSALLRNSMESLYTGIDARNCGPCPFPTAFRQIHDAIPNDVAARSKGMMEREYGCAIKVSNHP